MKNINLIAEISKENVLEDTFYYENCGADALYYYDVDSFLEEGEIDTNIIDTIYRNTTLPIYALARISSLDHIKKLIHAGADKVIVSEEEKEMEEIVREATKLFGEDRIFKYMKVSQIETSMDQASLAMNEGYSGILLDGDFTKESSAALADHLRTTIDMPVLIRSNANGKDYDFIARLLMMTVPEGLLLHTNPRIDMMDLKQFLKKKSLSVETFVSSMDFDDFKLNSDGMIPVVTQDYKTGQVLMLAYMTKESYEKTVETGKMTYYSRSRQELWCKGDTSGHYQYVKSLSIDCDYDTILAKVCQVGAACHTGNYTCFFTDLVKKDVKKEYAKNWLEDDKN